MFEIVTELPGTVAASLRGGADDPAGAQSSTAAGMVSKRPERTICHPVTGT